MGELHFPGLDRVGVVVNLFDNNSLQNREATEHILLGTRILYVKK